MAEAESEPSTRNMDDTSSINQRRMMYSCMAVMGVIATAIVALRLWARRKSTTELKLDDWLIIASLVGATLHFGPLRSVSVTNTYITLLESAYPLVPHSMRSDRYEAISNIPLLRLPNRHLRSNSCCARRHWEPYDRNSSQNARDWP